MATSEGATPLTVAEDALAYAARGWRVVPIAPRGKNPLVNDWPRAATVHPARIAEWWRRWPDAGVGIACGQASGVFVLDVDTAGHKIGAESLADLEATYGPLPDTVEAQTSTGGRHLFFAWPDGVEIRNDAGKRLGTDLDVRGEGGQVVAAPTIGANGEPYAWIIGNGPGEIDVAPAPAWLVELLTAAPTGAPRVHRIPLDGPGDRPGDRFAAEHSWPELLTADGATFLGERTHHAEGGTYELWARPGVDHVSATLYYGGTDVLKVFTSAWPGLDEGATYTRFGYWAATRHGGDHGAAAASLAARHGGLTLEHSLPPATPNGQHPRPTVYVNGRTLDVIAEEILAHLDEANDPPSLFVRAAMPTRLRSDETGRPVVEPLAAEHLRWHAAARMGFARRNVDKGPTPCIPSIDIFRSLSHAPAWPFPGLVGVTEAPIVRPDGAIRTEHGYDPATKLYHWRTADIGPIPDRPTPDELAAAVALVDDVLADFCWDTTADRANAWALLVTGLVRPLVAGQVPLAVLDAPEPGTGKSLLAEIVAIVATGRTAAIQPMPDTPEELEKRITGMLLGGATVVIFDNIEATLRSPVLAAALTADTWQGRILGRTGQVEVPNRATWMVTGNNVDVGGDLARRCYRIRLDARQARPWERDGFRHPDLRGWVAANRAAILHALCVIVRAWWVAGKPDGPPIAAMGGYTPWVRTVGGILHHAGITSLLANLTAFHDAADSDARAAEAFLAAWLADYGDRTLTTPEVTRYMEASDSRTREALPDEISGWWGTPTFTKRLGRWLLKRAGRHYGADGLHVVRCDPDRRHLVLWAVEDRLASASAGPAAITRGAETPSPAETGQGASYASLDPPTPCGLQTSIGTVGNELAKPRNSRDHDSDDPASFASFRPVPENPDGLW